MLKKKFMSALCVFTVVAVSTAALAEIKITHPYVQVVRKNAPVAAAYITMHNTGSQDDELIGVQTSAAVKVELHNTAVDDKGVARMMKIPGVGIATGETVSLEPGKKHIMLMQIKAPVSAGDEMYLTLRFANSAAQKIKFIVQKAGTKRSQIQMDMEASDHKKVLGHDEHTHDHSH